jgi:hypothetical protein
MTPRVLIPIALALMLIELGYGIGYHVHRCRDVAPVPVNIEAERLRIMAEIERDEVLPLRDSLNAAQARIDSLRALQPRVVVRWREVAERNWELSDTEAGRLLVGRIDERVGM